MVSGKDISQMGKYYAIGGTLKMIVGDIKRIDLGISSFERMITEGNLYVDKTRMIESFLNYTSSVQLITRQRRLGKSLNMDMLRCFLTDKEDLRHLFKGLYIETSSVWDKANSAPVFYFDFKGLRLDNYKQSIYFSVCELIDNNCSDVKLSRAVKHYLDNNDFNSTDGLYYLTESIFKATGKRSYILIDEYDKLLMEAYNIEQYEEVRSYIAAFLSSGLKGNHNLEKALLTGVMRISHESILSGLNNIVTFDVFGDDIYTDDYGLTDSEIEAISNLTEIDISRLSQWYNGIRIYGHAIYNIFSVMSFLARNRYECYWGKSGTMDIIANLLNNDRKAVLAELLTGEHVDVAIETRISLKDLSSGTNDQAFYSLLVQAGYLALEEAVPTGSVSTQVSIPNAELMIVWKQFILNVLNINIPKIRTLFDNSLNLELFSSDVEYFLSDRLSYHDLGGYKGKNARRVHERIYHVFILGILSAYDDALCKRPLSNRESGDGRFDILVERPDTSYIFEFKASKASCGLDKDALDALAQIDTKRYGEDLNSEKPLVKVGIALFGKTCKVRCR